MNIVTSYLHAFEVRAANLCITDLILRLQSNKINEDKIMFDRRGKIHSEQ